jgi:hypothetical protein
MGSDGGGLRNSPPLLYLTGGTERTLDNLGLEWS